MTDIIYKQRKKDGGQKNGGLLFFSPPAILNGILSLKLQNFPVK